MANREKQRPLIRYAGSAAETSIGSKPIGSELSAGFYSWRRGYQNLVRGLRSMNQSPRGLKPIPEPSVNQAENRGRFQFLHSEHKEQPILQPLAGEITLRAIEGRG
jgi:hypothetical protein